MTGSQRGEMVHELNQGLQHSSGSFELVAASALFAGIGWAFEQLFFDTSPLLTIAGAIFGFAIGASSLVIQYTVRMKFEDADRAAKAHQ